MSLNNATINDLIYGTRSTKSNIFQKLNQLLKPKYEHKTLQGWACSQECEKNEQSLRCTKKCRKINGRKTRKKTKRKKKKRKKRKKRKGWSLF